MARLGNLRINDLNFLMGTFLAITFFVCVVMLILAQNEQSDSLTAFGLARDDVQSLPGGKDGGKVHKEHARRSDRGKKSNKSELRSSRLNAVQHENFPSPNAEAPVVRTTTVPASGDEDENSAIGGENAPQFPQTDDFFSQPEDLAPDVTNDLQRPTGNAKMKATNPAKEKSREDDVTATKMKKLRLKHLMNLSMENFTSPFIDRESPKGAKKIITWYKPDVIPQSFSKRRSFENCPVSGCRFEFPLPDGHQADAVIFQGAHWRENPPIRQHADQAYIFYDMSSPALPRHLVWSPAWKAVFNWTWTYRHDSDIWEPLGLLKRKSTDKVKVKEDFLEIAKTKSRPVAVVYDECPSPTPSRREDYIKELSRYIEVDQFHPCSNTTCPPEDVGCSQTLTRDYFFLLALEEDLCRDHITEVFYRAWRNGLHVVPVVRGGATYSAYFPEGTYVDAAWFESSRDLGRYLEEVAANKALYSELLWRKDHWQRSPKKGASMALCKLCQKLFQLPHSRKRYPDIHRWYEGNACLPAQLAF